MLLSSCIYDEMQEGGQPVPATPEEQETPQPQTIQLSATLVGARTRAADGTNDGNFALETPITVSVDGTNYNYKTDATSISNPMVCQDATPPYFPVNGSSVRIVAFYPSAVSYSTTAQTFTVAHDQSQTATGTDNYKASDLMVGLPKADFVDDATPMPNSLIDGTGYTRKVKPTSKQIPLEFEHKMVKIRLHTTNNGATVKKVEMKGIKRSIDFNPSDSTFTNLSLATDDTDAAANTVIMYDDPSGSTADVTCTALIPKQDLAATTEFITVTTQSGVPLVYKLPEAYYFGPGKQYFFNVNINDYEITVTSSVYDWDDDDDANIDHGDGLAMKRSARYNPLWYVAKKNITSTKTDGKWTFAANELAAGNYYVWHNGMVNFANYTPVGDHDQGYNGWTACGIEVYGEIATWHLPTQQEWLSIIPLSNYYYDNIFSSSSPTKETIIEEHACTFGYPDARTPQTYKAYWSDYNAGSPSVAAGTRYAIRFLNTPYCSVWKYEYVSGSPDKLVVSSKLIDIMSDENTDENKALLKSKLDEAINAVASYWNEDEGNGSIQRSFGANGYQNTNSTLTANGYHGYFLSTTWGLTGNGSLFQGYTWNSNTDYYYELWFYYELARGGFGLYVGPVNETTAKSVRLFRDN